jgi:hypothetical protein
MKILAISYMHIAKKLKSSSNHIMGGLNLDHQRFYPL